MIKQIILYIIKTLFVNAGNARVGKSMSRLRVPGRAHNQLITPPKFYPEYFPNLPDYIFEVLAIQNVQQYVDGLKARERLKPVFASLT